MLASQIPVRHFSEILFLPFRVTTTNFLDDISKSLKPEVWIEEDATQTPEVLDPQFDTENACDAEFWQQAQSYQQQVYLHPFLHSALKNKALVRKWRRCDLKQLEYKSKLNWENKNFAFTFDVQCCELFAFSDGTAVLRLELILCEPLSNLAQIQKTLDEMRRLYPPYWDDPKKVIDTDNGKEIDVFGMGHYPASVVFLGSNQKRHKKPYWTREDALNYIADVRDPDNKHNRKIYDGSYELWDEHWKWLLEDLSSLSPYHTFGDDRLPLMSFIALQDVRSIDRGNWVRTCFADAPGTDRLPYAKKFLNDFEDRHCYDRYWHEYGDSTDAPSRILNCGYAFHMVGDYCDKYFFMNPRNGAFSTFRTIYATLGLLAHFQKAWLLNMSRALTELGQKNLEDESSDIQKLYADFIKFTAGWWHDEISPQEQGRELFQMWQRELRTNELYKEVRQELQDLVQFDNTRAQNVQASEQQSQTKQQTDLTTMAGIFAAMSIGISIVSMLITFISNSAFAFKTPLWLSRWEISEYGSLINFWLLFILLFLGIFLIYQSIKFAKPYWKKIRGAKNDPLHPR